MSVVSLQMIPCFLSAYEKEPTFAFQASLSFILSLTISFPSDQFILIIFLQVSGNALVSSQSSLDLIM